MWQHTAENYADHETEALYLKKSADETGSAFLSPGRSATVQNNLQSTRKSLGTAGFTFIGCKNTAFLKLRPVQSSIDNNQLSKSNEKSEAQKSYSDTLLTFERCRQ